MRTVAIFLIGFLIIGVMFNTVAIILNLFFEPIDTTMALLNALAMIACAYVAVNVYRREKLLTEVTEQFNMIGKG